ncbi:FxSxx-COOH system tetratricopeptide repeat protein [Streptomyces sp. NPDC017556]|uniref:FxSxx-COOH system tetratricopeptide repeat protein n=1 Tax=Streptomyces sp. NPDC017556 TaxID=3365002 RepID=UPI00378C892E
MEAKAPEARVVRSGQPRIMGNVPPKNPNFTGRESLLAAVERQLTEDETTAVLPHALHGLGGVGTSQIAVEYVYRHSGEYNVIWWIPAEQESLILAALAELAAGLGLEVGPQANTAVPAVREALRTGKPFDNWLLVFDNAEDIESVRSYFPNGGPGKIIVTSRNREWERVATPLSVDVFDREESIALLQRRARGLSTHDAGRLAEALGDLPLAVEQAGAWHAATGMPADEYLRLLDERRPGILELAPSPDYPLPVAAVWDISRHLPGLLHGAYAFVGVAGFWRDRIGDRAADPLGLAPFRFALRRLQTRTVLRTLATRAALTGPGCRLVAGLTRTVDGWLREPVDGRAVARARAAAAGHRVEWRLRNLRCGDEERAGLGAALRTGAPPPPLGQPLLVPASERTHWQDVRGALYLRPDSALDVTVADIGPRAASVAAPDAASVTVARGVRPRATPPVRADVLLIRGESAAAREAYRERWAEAPGDPHPLAGWLLAHTALHPGHRRLLARPERFAAAVAAEGPEVWEHAAHRLAAAPPPV